MDSSDDFDAFAASSWRQLVRTAVFLGCTHDEAEDLAQTTLLRCLESWERVSAAGDRDAYVYRVLVNAFRRARSRRWRDENPHGLATSANSYDGQPDEVEQRDLLRSLLAQLPIDQRKVLILRFYGDLSERQVASVMRIPRGTVKSKTSRAIQRMSNLLSEHDSEHTSP